jgi:hypothetical protein
MNVCNESEGNQLVAYFDILGTRNRVSRGLFDDLEAYDFAAPPETVASQFPSFRLAVFSDCAILSAPTDQALDFLRAVNFMTCNWSSDLVFVRGGVALGEIIWLSPNGPGKHLQQPNFSCARVYGKALVEAVTVEQKSGPGIVTFVSDGASIFLEAEIPGSILRGQSNILVSHTRQEMGNWRGFYDDWSKRKADDAALTLHLLATIRVLDMMKEGNLGVSFKRLFFPPDSSLE